MVPTDKLSGLVSLENCDYPSKNFFTIFTVFLGKFLWLLSFVK